jgi:hypothetical protein
LTALKRGLARSSDGSRELYKKLLNEVLQEGCEQGKGPKLHILSEPVAAMLECQKLLSEDACVLVIDVGGGTMDMTVFVYEDGFARQLLADDGSYDAGKKVDKYFMEYLIERVGGQQVWDDFLEMDRAPQKGALFTYTDRKCPSPSQAPSSWAPLIPLPSS